MIDTSVSCAGSTSVTDQPARAATGPSLCGVRVYVTSWPGANGPAVSSVFFSDKLYCTKPASMPGLSALPGSVRLKPASGVVSVTFPVAGSASESLRSFALSLLASPSAFCVVKNTAASFGVPVGLANVTTYSVDGFRLLNA